VVVLSSDVPLALVALTVSEPLVGLTLGGFTFVGSVLALSTLDASGATFGTGFSALGFGVTTVDLDAVFVVAFCTLAFCVGLLAFVVSAFDFVSFALSGVEGVLVVGDLSALVPVAPLIEPMASLVEPTASLVEPPTSLAALGNNAGSRLRLSATGPPTRRSRRLFDRRASLQCAKTTRAMPAIRSQAQIGRFNPTIIVCLVNKDGL